MDRDRQAGDPTTWDALARALGGSFTARPRGLVSPELVLLTPENEPFGRLLADAAGGTRLRAGGLDAEIEPAEGNRYVMKTGDEETLTAEPSGSPTHLKLGSGDRRYEARISLLRNRATALSSEGSETARLSGGLTNRRYRATFDPRDPSALPLAVFLLHHTATLRSRAYRTG